MNTIERLIKPIGVVHSPFKEKFGLPRQATLITSCHAEIEFFKPFDDINYVRGLDDFSDIWLIFGFHQHYRISHKPLVRPPRLGGNKKVGVFASRSPFRPNGLGISRVQLIEIKITHKKVRLVISCPDVVDGTPIYDIKPYIHYSDANEKAICGFAQETPKHTTFVEFKQKALEDLANLEAFTYPNLKEIIIELLTQSPCPAYKDMTQKKEYGVKLYDLNIIWEQSNNQAYVKSINRI